jgi:hypothetical protein
MLSTVDLCTGAQKGEIHGFFQKSISKLKGTDRELPQVILVFSINILTMNKLIWSEYEKHILKPN